MRKKSILSIIGMLLLGGFFVFSAITKMIPNVNYFDQTIQSQLGVSTQLSAFLARFIVGLELSLGVLLIAQQRGKRQWVLKSTLIMLVAFSLHLFFLYLKEGNDINCGCMGDLIEMSPLASIVKNIGLIMINFLLIISVKKRNTFSLNSYVQLTLLVLPIAVIFMVDPMGQSPEVKWEKILNQGTSWDKNPELVSGRSLAPFLSLTCGHCLDAAKELNAIKKDSPELPIFLVFQSMASVEETQDAFEYFEYESGILEMPVYFANREGFVDFLVGLGHSGVPVMVWLQDGRVFRHTSGAKINAKEMKSWLK